MHEIHPVRAGTEEYLYSRAHRSLQGTLGLTLEPSKGVCALLLNQRVARRRGACPAPSALPGTAQLLPSLVILTGCEDHHKTTQPVSWDRNTGLPVARAVALSPG